jgi:TusA-related sulfurtransferase
MLLTLDLKDMRCPDALIRGKKAISALRSSEATHLAIKTIEPSLKRDLEYFIAHTGDESLVHQSKRPISSRESDIWEEEGAVKQDYIGQSIHELVFKK